LESAKYFNLATFRKSGDAVETPVWFAPDGEVFYVFSAGDAGKVKRLRNSTRARVAECDVRGQLLGDWIDAEARLVDEPAEVEKALAALRRKYGWQMLATDWLSTLTGRFRRRRYIAVEIRRGD
jgi:PPOX class probable F420-dependent enzyme